MDSFKKFLQSDTDEATFYGCDKTSLITLREYLEEFKKLMSEYENYTNEYVKSISDKNKWVVEVLPSYLGLAVRGKKDPNIGVRLDKKQNKYVFDATVITRITDRIKLPFREKVIENSQEELIEIGKIADALFSQHRNIESVSGHFNVENLYLESYLHWEKIPLFVIEHNQLATIDYSYKPMPELDREKLLRRIMIKK